MSKQSLLRHFKAALFETVCDPTRLRLLRRLSQSRIEVDNLLLCLGPAERADALRHLAVLEGNRIVERYEVGPRIYYSLGSAALQEALVAISENPSLSTALSDPLGIEILEFLRDGPVEHGRLIRELEPEERPRIPDQLEGLITAGLVDRSFGPDSIFYEAKQARVHNVLQLLRGHFEDHMSTALAIISQVSSAHIKEESD